MQNDISDKEMLEILEQNIGFEDPKIWLEFAKRNDFQAVKAARLTRCPVCTSSPGKPLGQYVYYSSLLALQECSVCSLVYVDGRIDQILLQRHFETAYKEEGYFHKKRAAVFSQIASIVLKLAKKNARILDIGGAKGHLLNLISLRDRELELVLSDISQAACDYASKEFGLESFSGACYELPADIGRFDLVLVIDALYYEPDLSKFGKAISELVKDGGSVVFRIPNKLCWIKTWQSCLSLLNVNIDTQSKVKFFNPEHLYVFSRPFLSYYLKTYGFTSIEFQPSRPLFSTNPFQNLLRRIYFIVAIFVFYISLKQIIITPGMLVTAVKKI